MVAFLRAGFRVSTRRACDVIRIRRSSYYYRSHADPMTDDILGYSPVVASKARIRGDGLLQVAVGTLLLSRKTERGKRVDGHRHPNPYPLPRPT